jgi:hypothetical protein
VSNPIAVNISGTYTEKARPNNGLERVAAYLDEHRLTRVAVVAYVEWHSVGETRTGKKVAVTIPAVEPTINAQGHSVPGLPVDGDLPRDAAGQVFYLLDAIRRSEGKGAVADTLFGSVDVDLDDDGDDDGDGGELPGQTAIDIVPPPSGEEITADLDERRAAKAAKKAAAPAAAFSAPAE